MNGYQPKMRCNSCTKQNDCKKYKDGKEACQQYEALPPPPPPKSGSLTISSQGLTYTPPQKQRTVLSVRDFAILYELVKRELDKCGNLSEAKESSWCHDLIRIRDKLGELNIEVETPSVEVEE